MSSSWLPIDDASTTADDDGLHSGVGIDLEANLADLRSNVTKAFGESYYLGPSSSGGATPPAGDSTLDGPAVDVRGSASNDPEGIGLRLSSPPGMPLAVPLGDWPLSAAATGLRIIVGCATELADVDLYAFAVINGNAVPYDPVRELVMDDEGIASWSSDITGDGAYQRVGTTAPSGTQNVKPVVLSVDFQTAQRRDFGYHGGRDSIQTCKVYLAILSQKGSQATEQGQAGVSTFAEGGRRLVTQVAFSVYGTNPGPLHRWLYFTGNADTEVTTTAAAWFPRYFGVVQVRPDDVDNPGTADTAYVIHPPIGLDHAARTDSDFEIYDAGTIEIHGWSIDEVTT